jgi:putative colanic acid biosynthesis acetyltransferase WcaB
VTRGIWADLSADRAANDKNTKGRFVVSAYRIGRLLQEASSRCKILSLSAWVYSAWYKLCVVWLMGIDLPLAVDAGAGLVIYHGVGLVVHEACVLGANVVLRQGCTLGAGRSEGSELVPQVGNDVEFGAGSIVLGGVHLGDGCKIGAGSVVLDDVPPGAVVAGNPARVVREGDA